MLTYTIRWGLGKNALEQPKQASGCYFAISRRTQGGSPRACGTAAASRGDNSWQVELAIPFAELGTSVADGTKWKATIVRNRIGKGEGNDYSSWAPVTKFRFSHPRYFQDFHDPSSLRQILFRDEPVAGRETVDTIEFGGVVSERF